MCDVGIVDSIQFGLVTSTDLKKISVVEVTSAPKKQNRRCESLSSVNDPRLGTIQESRLCSTCGNSIARCPGHSGSMKLATPMMNANFMMLIPKILTCICVNCSALLIDPYHYKFNRLIKSGSNYKKRINTAFMMAKRTRRCIAKFDESHGFGINDILSPEDAIRLGWCGWEQPTGFIRDCVVLIRPVYLYDEENDPKIVGDIVRKMDVPNNVNLNHLVKNMDTYKSSLRGPRMTLRSMYTMLRNVNEETTRTLGFDSVQSPLHCVMMKYLIIPSIQTRVSSRIHQEDDLTSRLRNIEKVNSHDKALYDVDMSMHVSVQNGDYVKPRPIASCIYTRNKQPVIEELLNVVFDLQRSVASYQDGKFFIRLDRDYGRDKYSVKNRFTTTKNQRGRMRQHCMGKRGDFTARFVTTPNTYMTPDQVGVPMMALMKLTFPEMVGIRNYSDLLSAVMRGPFVYPGANYVARKGVIYLPDSPLLCGLQIGDIVHRHLRENDMILANRQPTLHRYSIMAFRVLPVHSLTIQLHLSVTTATNADFDGDEFNLMSFGSLEAVSEAMVLMNVNNNLFKDGKLLVGFVQHSCLSAYKLTEVPDYPMFSICDAMALLYIGNDDDIFNETCNTLSSYKQTMISGREFLTCVLPNYNGEEPITKTSLNSMCGAWLRDKYRDNDGTRYISFLTRILEEWILRQGTTLSTHDCIALNIDPRGCVDMTLHRAEELLVYKKSNPRISNEVEGGIMTLLNRVRDEVGYNALEHLRLQKDNGLIDIVVSGSRGNLTHVTQNTGLIGQQLGLNGHRYTACTSHVHKNHLVKCGFVKSSFMDGLTSMEYFHHLRSSRIGLVATAVQTADTGYVFRKMCKALEDYVIAFDGSVRNVSNGQLLYTGFGFQTNHLVNHAIPFVEMSIKETLATYYVGHSEMLKSELYNILELREAVLALRTPNAHIVPMPVHFISEIRKSMKNMKTKTLQKKPIDYDVCIRSIQCMWYKLLENGVPDNLPIRACFFAFMSMKELKRLIDVGGSDLFFNFLSNIFQLIREEVIEPETPIGIIASQSFTQPLTQLNLDTFHLSGERTELVGGVQRIKEILHLTRDIATPSMKIYLKPGCTVKPIELVGMRLMDVMMYWHDGDESDMQKDHMYLKIFLDKTKMMIRHVSPRVISNHILPTLAKDVTCTYSHITEDVWWVKLIQKHLKGMGASKLYHSIRSKNTLVCGIANIKDFFIREEEIRDLHGHMTKQSIIITLGSNLLDIVKLSYVDVSRTTTNNIMEIYDIYGIDACMSVIEQNLCDVMLHNAASVSRLHIRTIARSMCSTGIPCAINFTGMSMKNRSSQLKLATFERSLDGFLQAGVSGTMDKTCGTSECVMLGKKINIGTGAKFSLLASSFTKNNARPLHPRPLCITHVPNIDFFIYPQEHHTLLNMSQLPMNEKLLEKKRKLTSANGSDVNKRQCVDNEIIASLYTSDFFYELPATFSSPKKHPLSTKNSVFDLSLVFPSP